MIQKGDMFGAIQPNVVMQGYMSMMFLYMAKHQLLAGQAVGVLPPVRRQWA